MRCTNILVRPPRQLSDAGGRWRAFFCIPVPVTCPCRDAMTAVRIFTIDNHPPTDEANPEDPFIVMSVPKSVLNEFRNTTSATLSQYSVHWNIILHSISSLVARPNDAIISGRI